MLLNFQKLNQCMKNICSHKSFVRRFVYLDENTCQEQNNPANQIFCGFLSLLLYLSILLVLSFGRIYNFVNIFILSGGMLSTHISSERVIQHIQSFRFSLRESRREGESNTIFFIFIQRVDYSLLIHLGREHTYNLFIQRESERE